MKNYAAYSYWLETCGDELSMTIQLDDAKQRVVEIRCRDILAADPKLKLLVAHGLYDLATPYFGTQIRLDQLPAFGSRDRVRLVVYPGGHMFYSRDMSRQALRDTVRAMMKGE